MRFPNFIFYLIFISIFFLDFFSCRSHKETIDDLPHHINVAARPDPPSPKGNVDCKLRFYKDSTEIDSAILSKYLRKENDSSFITYLDTNIIYPQMELDLGKSGNLFVEILYDAKFSKDTGFAIAKPIYEAPGFSKEVSRVFEKRPVAICDSLFSKKPPSLKHVCVEVKFIIQQ